MNAQFTSDSIKDFVALFSGKFTPCGVVDAIRDCLAVLPAMKRADTPAGEAEAIAALAALDTADRASWRHVALYTLQIIQELCHYPPSDRERLLRTALVYARLPAAKEREWKSMRPAVLACLQGLDARTKAILTALDNLCSADSEVGGGDNADYGNILPELGPVDLDVLRRDPALAPLARANDAAQIIQDRCR